jgi:predicted nucleic acid binding AN1-type Zn finger protein
MSDSNQEIKKKKKKKKKTPRCAHSDCRVKLKIIDWACKCGKIYCAKHRSPGITDKGGHECSYDWTNKAELEKKIDSMKCIASKLINV